MYLSVPVAQMQTGPFSSVNCGPSVAEDLLLLTSVGALNISAARIRVATGDMSGGIEGGLLAKTMTKLAPNYPMTYFNAGTRQNLSTLLLFRSVGIIINCKVTVKTKHRTNSFTGLHWVCVAGATLKDGTYKVEDPGTTYAGWQRWPKELLFDAAEAVGGFFVLQAPATENIDKDAAAEGVRVFTEPDRDSKVVKRLAKGQTVHVIKTTKGGPWKARDGRIVHGWHQIKAGFMKGESLV